MQTIGLGYAHVLGDRKPYPSYCHGSARSQHVSPYRKLVSVFRAFCGNSYFLLLSPSRQLMTLLGNKTTHYDLFH